MREKDLQEFTIFLHNRFCYQNHISACSWYKEISSNQYHNFEGNAHKEWTIVATEVLGEAATPLKWK